MVVSDSSDDAQQQKKPVEAAKSIKPTNAEPTNERNDDVGPEAASAGRA